jgi:hypothetical protein
LTNIETNENTLDGLDITTTSAVTITSAQANNNIDNGVIVSQLAGPVIAPVITLTDIGMFGNGIDGLHVEGYGNIIANKLYANSNGGYGTYLNNEPGTGSVTILNTKGYNFVGFNGNIGMFIASRGVVTVTGVEALGNAQDGVRIINSNAIVPNAVTVNSLLLRNNGLRDDFGTVTVAEGLMIDSDGIVTVNNSWSLGNTHNGYLVATSSNVFFNNSTAIHNDRAGIFVLMLDTSKTLKLTGSTWMGNLRNPSLPTDRNLMANVTPVIL